MALTCPVGFDVETLRSEIQTIYGRVAASPAGDFHFHRGPDYASAVLGYNREGLAQVPDRVTSSFAGVGNPHSIVPLTPGMVVVDVGCGVRDIDLWTG